MVLTSELRRSPATARPARPARPGVHAISICSAPAGRVRLRLGHGRLGGRSMRCGRASASRAAGADRAPDGVDPIGLTPPGAVVVDSRSEPHGSVVPSGTGQCPRVGGRGSVDAGVAAAASAAAVSGRRCPRRRRRSRRRSSRRWAGVGRAIAGRAVAGVTAASVVLPSLRAASGEGMGLRRLPGWKAEGQGRSRRARRSWFLT